jgi:hypothetical protein
LLVRHVLAEAIEQRLEGRGGSRRALGQPVQEPQPLHRPIPKGSFGVLQTDALLAVHLVRRPSSRRRFNDRDVDRRGPGEIDAVRDDDQFARHRLQRRARVPEALEVTEELPAGFRKWTCCVASSRDRTVKPLFKHGRPPS